MTNNGSLAAEHTATGQLQRALLERLDVHKREGMLPTSSRFLYYELIQLGVVPKKATGVRRADQSTIDALTRLREIGLVPWDWIVDETRELTEWQTALSVAEYVIDAARNAFIDRWDGTAAPLILCESRSLAGVLRNLAATYACPSASTNGQCRGFLITKVARALQAGQRVLYLGDWDWCGHQIEAATRRTLSEHSSGLLVPERWERVALTEAQVEQNNLPVISQGDHRYRPVQHHDAVEIEAFGQANIVGALRARLDELMPEPLEDVLERQQRQRAEVAEQLRNISKGTGGPNDVSGC